MTIMQKVLKIALVLACLAQIAYGVVLVAGSIVLTGKFDYAVETDQQVFDAAVANIRQGPELTSEQRTAIANVLETDRARILNYEGTLNDVVRDLLIVGVLLFLLPVMVLVFVLTARRSAKGSPTEAPDTEQ